MPTRDEDLLTRAVEELVHAVLPVIDRLGMGRAQQIVAERIQSARLVPSPNLSGPTAVDAARAILRALEDHAQRPASTAAGAHDVARRAAIAAGVPGADRWRAYRPTRAHSLANPNPKRKREGTRGRIAGESPPIE